MVTKEENEEKRPMAYGKLLCQRLKGSTFYHPILKVRSKTYSPGLPKILFTYLLDITYSKSVKRLSYWKLAKPKG